MYKQNLALINLQGLIYHKTRPTKQPDFLNEMPPNNIPLVLHSKSFFLLDFFTKTSLLFSNILRR